MALATTTLATLPSAGNFGVSAGTLLDAVTSIDGDYGISAAAAGQFYGTIPDLGLDDTINAVRVKIRARLAEAGARDLAAGITIGSLYYADTQIITATDWAEHVFEWTLNPNTGTAWTGAEVDAIARVYCRCAAGSGATIAHIDHLLVEVDHSSGGDVKTSTATIALGLDTTAGAAKTAGGAAALDLDLATDSGSTKTATGTASLAVLLGVDTTTVKAALAATGLDLTLTLAGAASSGHETKTAATTLALALAADAITAKQAAAGATLTLALDTGGDTGKTGRAVVDLALILDTIGHTAKTAGVEAALTLALHIAAAALTDTTTPPGRTLHITADDRTITITADHRTLTIDRQDRRLTA